MARSSGVPAPEASRTEVVRSRPQSFVKLLAFDGKAALVREVSDQHILHAGL